MKAKEFTKPKLPSKETGQLPPISNVPKKGDAAKKKVEELVKQAK